jgi:hypothetical protein
MIAKEIALKGSDLRGKMRAIVLVRKDPSKLGRIGVYIPRIMGMITNFSSSSETNKTAKSTDNSNNELILSDLIKTSNYIWAKPAAFCFLTKDQQSGDWRIPPLGAEIFVEFIDSDPQQLYFMPYGPVDIKNPRVLPNDAEAGSPDQELIYQDLENGTIGFDHSDGKSEFFITLKDGQKIKIDRINDNISIETKSSAANISLKGGKISVTASEIAASCKKLEVTASESAVVESNGSLSLVTNDSSVWQPNCMSVCPLTLMSHGGPSAGIVLLKGTK